ncbi:Hypothetical predicted protein [Cloeon dipterum]|uniref:Cuticle protein CPCFC domain-containing protein n=1 Tax=Cloeon dipterum TaxID=197152 RepID=A0A8S1E023_9INSE|nr:Hypothetical predicted protein [Cloeon dipterum]
MVAQIALAVLSLAAAVCAAPGAPLVAVAPAYVKAVELHARPHYSFNYGVNDPHTGDHEEAGPRPATTTSRGPVLFLLRRVGRLFPRAVDCTAATPSKRLASPGPDTPSAAPQGLRLRRSRRRPRPSLPSCAAPGNPTPPRRRQDCRSVVHAAPVVAYKAPVYAHAAPVAYAGAYAAPLVYKAGHLAYAGAYAAPLAYKAPLAYHY